MSVASGAGGGGRKGRDDPSKKKGPASKSGGGNGGEKWHNQVQCSICHLYVVDLEHHRAECVGKRGYTGDFACTMPGCTFRCPFYAQLGRHFKAVHPGEEMPEVMRNYVR
jgi:hypothetical protein